MAELKLNLPPFCHTCHICHICPTLERFGIFGHQLEALKHPSVTALVRINSEDLPDGLVETAGADGVDTVEDAPVLVCGVNSVRRLLGMVLCAYGLR